jgi:hypothetical protein
MLYFTRTVTTGLGEQFVEFAISENADRLERLTAQGFEQCSLATFREAWRRKDTEAFARLRAAALTASSSHSVALAETGQGCTGAKLQGDGDARGST